ncbi:response regulator [bacterium]|nr:response regulator [bacterium]
MASHRILIVEDQREVSRLLRTALETLEYDLEVVEIPSGEEAVLDASRKPVDLLLSDYRLPGMSGIELMSKVRSHRPQVKVILITGQTDPKIRKEIAEAGADAFFLKPVPIADFLDAVERHLGLVETFLPPEPISTDDEEVQRTLPDLLAGLRQDLEAKAVLLLNDAGDVLARAGDLPDSSKEVSLLSSLLSIYSAGQKVSRLIGQHESSSWYIFDGEKQDLIFAPVGQMHAMLVIGKGLADQERVLKTIEVFSAARETIRKNLPEKINPPEAAQEPVTTPAETVEKSIRELEPLLKEAKKKMKPAEVNEFWDKAAHQHKAPTKPDMLSYDQAKQLGLTPEEE